MTPKTSSPESDKQVEKSGLYEAWINSSPVAVTEKAAEPLQFPHRQSEVTDKSEGVSAYPAPHEPPELPIGEKFRLWRDEEGDYLVQATERRNAGSYLTADGRTPDDAVWAMRQTLEMAHNLVEPAAPPVAAKSCKHSDDLFCPCKDGDPCHYEGENQMAPPVAEEGAAMDMARSGAVIRDMSNDLYFVDWGNVRFGTTLKRLGDLGHDLGLFVTRKKRELEDKR